MEKQLAKEIKMVENEREIRDLLIAKSEKLSEELLGVGKLYREVYGPTWPQDEELSRTTKRELHMHKRHLIAVRAVGKEIREYCEMLKATKAERAEPVQSISV